MLSAFDPLFEKEKLSKHFDEIKCDFCSDNPAIFECIQCDQSKNGKVVYWCERHVGRPEGHQEHNRSHNFKRIVDLPSEALKEEFLLHLEPNLNTHKEILKTQLLFLDKCGDEARDEIQEQMQGIMNQFTENLKLWHDKCLREIEVSINSRKNEIRAMQDTSESLANNYYRYRDYKNNEGNLTEEQSKDIEIRIRENYRRVNQYEAKLGPHIRLEPVGDKMKKLALRVVDYQISSEKVDFTSLSSSKWRPITPMLTKIYNVSKDLPLWCLRDTPCIVVPHPDFDKQGKAAKRQIELLATMAVNCDKVARVNDIELLSNRLGLLKCDDGIVRRVNLRYLHESFFPPKSDQENYVLELSGRSIAAGNSDWFLETIENLIEKEFRLKNWQQSGDGFVTACLPRARSSGSEADKVSGTVVYDLLLADRRSLLAAVDVLQKESVDGGQLNGVRWSRRTNCFLTFADETQLPPIPIDIAAKNPLEKLKLYQFDSELNYVDVPSMAVEVWMDLRESPKVMNSEPFRKRFLNAEVSFSLISFLEDAKDFRVEFIKPIHDAAPTSWIAKVIANKENLVDKLHNLLDSRKHFSVPKY